MVIKGKSVAGAARLANHLEREDTNGRVEVKELRGVAAEDLRGALREMEAVASACPNCEKPFYHASINTRLVERLTDAQRMKAIDRLEQELGLTGQPRVVVVHEKKDREHTHIVWSRIDTDNMLTISDSHNFRKHELVGRELEREFGHERVQGAHVEREGRERPERTPSHKEHQQAERTGVSPQEARDHITKLWQRADGGQAFAKALDESGWILARGDRRDFVAIDPQGGTHSIARRVEGATAKDIRARLADIDRDKLPSVTEARQTQRARQDRQPEQAREPPRITEQVRPQPARGERVRVIGSVVMTGRVAAAALKAAEKIADSLGNIAEGLLGGGASKSKDGEGDRAAGQEGQDMTPVVAPLDARPRQPTPEQEEARAREDHAKSARHARYLQDFGREVPDEMQLEADIERSRRGRER